MCFHQFVPEYVAVMADDEIEALLHDAGLIRHRLKLFAIRQNAQALLRLEQAGVDFSSWLWGFVGGVPRLNFPRTMQDVPSQEVSSQAMSKALKKAGFTFVGPTICYAFMQSMGLVNDHLQSCPRSPKC